MKKTIFIFLLLLNLLIFTSCSQYLEVSSLEEYSIKASRNGGYSSISLDKPDCFLLDSSFIEKYNYVDGGFFWREADLFFSFFNVKDVKPEIVILHLKYDKEIYDNAKNEMLNKILPYNDKFYFYNDYVFYENFNYIYEYKTRNFPETFTMACYNDRLNTLDFIGFDYYIGSNYPSKEILDDIDGNWKLFIDTYYEEYYDFNI